MLDYQVSCRPDSDTIAPPTCRTLRPLQAQLVPLADTLPPRIDRQLGYQGNARYVAFQLSELCNALLCSDGRCRNLITDPTALRIFRNRIAPRAHLHEVDLASILNGDAQDVLVIDRVTGLGYVASANAVERLLKQRKYVHLDG